MSSKANNELRIWFELADRLGYTVAELQARMPAHEFARWIAFLSIRSEEEEAAIAEAESKSHQPKIPPSRLRGF